MVSVDSAATEIEPKLKNDPTEARGPSHSFPAARELNAISRAVLIAAAGLCLLFFSIF